MSWRNRLNYRVLRMRPWQRVLLGLGLGIGAGLVVQAVTIAWVMGWL